MAKEAKKIKNILRKIALFSVIFTYILLTGCEDIIVEDACTSETYLNIDAPTLLEENGYYKMQYLNEYVQTFTTLRATTGASPDAPEKVAWLSNKEINLYGNWTNLVNESSYTDIDGEAFTVLAVWGEFIGDTVTVYCGYDDACGTHFVDSLKIIVTE
jgi:hypothetical protein